MMRRRWIAALAGGLALMSGATTSSADVIVDTLPEISVFTNGPFSIGTFNYVIPVGHEIVAVNVAGGFGNSAFPGSSARTPIFVDDVFIVECFGDFPPPDNGCNAFDFSVDVASSEFFRFLDGSADATGDFISGGAVRIDELTLTITTRQAVAEPGVLLLLGAGLAGVAARRRRNRA